MPFFKIKFCAMKGPAWESLCSFSIRTYINMLEQRKIGGHGSRSSVDDGLAAGYSMNVEKYGNKLLYRSWTYIRTYTLTTIVPSYSVLKVVDVACPRAKASILVRQDQIERPYTILIRNGVKEQDDPSSIDQKYIFSHSMGIIKLELVSFSNRV